MPPGSVLVAKPVYPAFPAPQGPANDNIFKPKVANDNVWHPKWARPTPRALGGRLNFYWQAGQLLNQSWTQFSDELGLGQFLALHPYGDLHVWGWSTSCRNAMNCAGGGAGTITAPGVQGISWSDQLTTCTSLCTVPTALVQLSSLNSQPYLWSGNASKKIGYGYWLKADATRAYMRVKLVVQAPASAPTNQFYLATRLRPNPGLLDDPFPMLDPFGDPSIIPGTQPGTSPLPNLLPMTQPVWQPGPLPDVLPYSVPRPRPGALPGFDPSFLPELIPGPATSPAAEPWVAPGVSVAPAPGGHVSVAIEVPPVRNVPPEPPHVMRPPRAKEKESKSRGGAAVAAAMVYGAATETNDFIEAAWQAMGTAGGWQTKVKGQKTNPAEMVADLYHAIGDDHFSPAVFWAQLPVEVAKNEVVDRGIGTVGQLGTSASQNITHGRPVGYGFGGTLGGGPKIPAKGTPDYVYPWNQ